MANGGISSIIGAAIAIAIFFTIIVPTWMYMQGLQATYMEEVGRRLQYELERLNEKLEIHATLTPPDAFGRRILHAVIFNPSSIAVTIPSIYVESTRTGLQQIPVNLVLTPGQLVTISLGYVVQPGEEVTVKAVTSRGNGFTAPETLLGPSNLPYLLIVSVSNMSQGYMYEVEVRAVELGCVSPAAGEFAEGCQSVASESFWPYGATDKERVSAFMVAPGTYRVRLRVYEWVGSGWGLLESFDIPEVNVTDHTSVRFTLPPRPSTAPIPLRIHSPRPNSIWTLMGSDYERVLIPFKISLGNLSTPLRNIDIELEITGQEGVDIIPEVTSVTVKRLDPGETFSGYFTLQVKLGEGSLKGQITYTLRISGAVDEETAKAIDLSRVGVPELSGLRLVFIPYSEL